MFEDSLFASCGDTSPLRSRWASVGTTAASVGVQAALIGVAVLIPLLRTAVLPLSVDPPAAVVFHAPVPPPPVRVQAMRVENASPVSMSSAAPARIEAIHGNLPTRGTPSSDGDEAPALVSSGSGMTPMGSGTAIEGIGSGSGPVVRAAPTGKVRVSAGVSAGMLLSEMRPVYPQIARAAGISGTVVVTATIDKTGRIIGAQAVSGPAMLRGAALDAVRAARYRPYLLNGEPVEVETTVSVTFRMGS